MAILIYATSKSRRTTSSLTVHTVRSAPPAGRTCLRGPASMVCRRSCGFRASSVPTGPADLVRHASGVAAAEADYERDREDGLMRALPALTEAWRCSDGGIEHHRKNQQGRFHGPDHRDDRSNDPTHRSSAAGRERLLNTSRQRPQRRAAHRAARLGDHRRREHPAGGADAVTDNRPEALAPDIPGWSG